MACDHRHSFLNATIGPRIAWSLLLSVVLTSSSCGLILDGVERLLPKENARTAICGRDTLEVGVAAGPYPPFIFPIMDTRSGPRVAGLDIELVREIGEALERQCGASVRPTLRLVPFQDLFSLVHEGKIDLFISATPADVVGSGRGGFAYSLPYLSGSGLTVIARNQGVANEVQHRLQSGAQPLTRLSALEGFRVGVVDGSSGSAYAEANFTNEQFIVCNSLTAAFHAQRVGEDPPDLILGSHPVLQFMVRHKRPDWVLVTVEQDKPLLFTHENFSIVVGDDRLYLLWFLNNLLFDLENSGALARIRHRWLEDHYDEQSRAEVEGLPVDEKAKKAQARDDCYVGSPGFGKLRSLGRE